jgi:light-regulated signal transduction histidine kinase (bacteriophytochrome)
MERETATKFIHELLDLLVKQGGSDLFITAGFPPALIQVGSAETPTSCLVWVRDNGIGIEAEYADKIFVIFQRLHARDAYGGTGIGLSMCKKIVEYHGGRIWLDTAVTSGAVFRWTMPMAGSTDISAVRPDHHERMSDDAVSASATD